MKKIIIVVLIALSFVACEVNNDIQQNNLDQDMQNASSLISSNGEEINNVLDSLENFSIQSVDLSTIDLFELFSNIETSFSFEEFVIIIDELF